MSEPFEVKMKKIYGTIIQHKNCKVCKKHPRFNLEDEVFIHGKIYKKRFLLELIEDAGFGI